MGAGSAIAVPAGCPMGRPLLVIGRPLAAAEIVRPGTARREGTSLWEGKEWWHDARNLSQAILGPLLLATHQVEARNRGHQARGIGMERAGEQLADLGLLDLA